MSTSEQPPTEEELRAAYEAELKRIRIEQILLEQVVSLVNMGMRRTGLGPGTEDERDLGQVRIAIEAVRALTPLIEQTAPSQATAIREALSQLQLAFVRLGGASGAGTAPTATPGPGPSASPGGEPSQRPGAAAGPAGAPEPAGGESAPPEPVKPGEPGPAERSGRLWVPGR